MRSMLLTALFAALPAAACTQPASSEPELAPAALSGAVHAPDTTPYEVVLHWSNTAGQGDTDGIFGRAPLDAASRWSLDLTDAPPQELLNDYTQGGLRPRESKIGIAEIGAFPVGWDGTSEPAAYAIAARHVVAWVDSDIQPGTFSEALVGGPLTRGYHVLEVIPAVPRDARPIDPCEAFDAGCEFSAADPTPEALAGFFACVDAAAAAAGCIGPSPAFDRLVPTTEEVDALELEVLPADAERDLPNWT